MMLGMAEPAHGHQIFEDIKSSGAFVGYMMRVKSSPIPTIATLPVITGETCC